MCAAPPRPPRAPTIRTIAAAAGVSPMTVSLALRDHPSAAAATRRRVQRIAAKLGYRTDPTIAKLMTHLRTQRSHRLQAALGCLTTFPRLENEPYVHAIADGAKARAGELGYSMELLVVGKESTATPARLERILRARGVQGLLLLPMATSGEFHGVDHWERFSVVSATLSVTAPVTHRVVPNAFDNVLEICRKLGAQGRQRLGLVTTREQDARVGHRFTAAIGWHNRYACAHPVEPLVLEGPLRVVFADWFQRENPDAIIGHSAGELMEIEQLLPPQHRRRLTLVSTSKVRVGDRVNYAGIDERPEEIGRASTDLLASLIQHGDRGLPMIPRVTMIEGIFVDGKTAATPAHR
jgi:DNA-binding LacI/PurR family transcriptional regulator